MIAESILWNREICNDMKDWVKLLGEYIEGMYPKKGGMDLCEQIQEYCLQGEYKYHTSVSVIT
jgi:hypothetical protein